jgi:hypothetical protein
MDATTDAMPVEAGPTAYTSCLDWLTMFPNSVSGVFYLRDSTGNVYDGYCEMGADSGGGGDAGDAGPPGGWTLVLKIDGNQSTFPYDDALWTNATSYSPGKPDLDKNEAKLASFWSVPFTEMRVGMIDGNVTRWLILPLASTSMLDLMNQGNQAPTPTTLGRAAWEGLLVNGSLQQNCNWEGVNPEARLRIGIVGDESPDCATNPSPDSFIGFGSNGTFQGGSPDCGNIARDTDDNGDQTTKTFGYVMVR